MKGENYEPTPFCTIFCNFRNLPVAAGVVVVVVVVVMVGVIYDAVSI
jgi:hypothetical protein